MTATLPLEQCSPLHRRAGGGGGGRKRDGVPHLWGGNCYQMMVPHSPTPKRGYAGLYLTFPLRKRNIVLRCHGIWRFLFWSTSITFFL